METCQVCVVSYSLSPLSHENTRLTLSLYLSSSPSPTLSLCLSLSLSLNLNLNLSHTRAMQWYGWWLLMNLQEDGNTISNYVTDLANQGQSKSKSYLNLGTKLSSSPEIYYTTLKVEKMKWQERGTGREERVSGGGGGRTRKRQQGCSELSCILVACTLPRQPNSVCKEMYNLAARKLQSKWNSKYCCLKILKLSLGILLTSAVIVCILSSDQT